MKQMNLFTLGTLSAVFAAQPGFAAVKVFQPQQSPRILENTLKANPATNHAEINEKQAQQVVFNVIEKNSEVFGLQKVSDGTLLLKHSEKTPEGLALRFVQQQNGINVEGAELVALFDKSGELTTLNSSLATIDAAQIQQGAMLSRESALKIAISKLGIQNAELGNGDGDGLRLVKGKHGFTLVWQFSIREALDGSDASHIQVIASGKRAGEVLKSFSLMHSTAKPGTISIFDASVSLIMPNPLYKGVKVRKNGHRWGLGVLEISPEAKKADITLHEVRDFYRETFDRDSFDGKGAPLAASVNVNRFTKHLDLLKMRENAAWVGPWKFFIIGSGGKHLGNFSESLDVIGHEFTHAVVSATSALAPDGQSGALNEHLADVFGAMIQSHYEPDSIFYLIGEKCLRGEWATKAPALRNMLDPHASFGGQPAHMSEMPAEYRDCTPSNNNDKCGVHDLNGIPNKAVALIVKQLGWEASQRMLYRVMTVRLRSTSDFADYRDQMVDECDSTLSKQSCDIVRQAFAEVGL